jgi:hypothetical protein
MTTDSDCDDDARWRYETVPTLLSRSKLCERKALLVFLRAEIRIPVFVPTIGTHLIKTPPVSNPRINVATANPTPDIRFTVFGGVVCHLT